MNEGRGAGCAVLREGYLEVFFEKLFQTRSYASGISARVAMSSQIR